MGWVMRRGMMAVLVLAACEGRAPAEPELPAMKPLPSAVPFHGRLGAIDRHRAPPDIGGWYSNVYDIMPPRFDSLAHEHPQSYCTTLRTDVEERVDCLRLPVQVDDVTVWTDSSGYFTAPGPYRPGDTLEIRVNPARLPRWHKAPGARSNCAVDSELNRDEWPFGVGGAHRCFPSSLLNMRTDSLYVVVPAEPDTILIPARWDQTWMLRLAKPDMKVRIWSLVYNPWNPHHQEYWLLMWEGRTDWNSELILTKSNDPRPWGDLAKYIQVKHPTQEWEICTHIRVKQYQPPSHFAQLGFDWSSREWDPRYWDCAGGMDKHYARGTIHRCPPPALADSVLRGQMDGHTPRCERFFGH